VRPVNLIPPDERRGERAPLRSGPIAYGLVATLLLLFVGVYMLVATGNTIAEREVAVTALEQDLESSQARAQALQSFTNFASLEDQRTVTVDSLARSRFDWQRVLRELALVIPTDVSLTSLDGGVGGADAEGGDASASSSGITSPTMTMGGCAASHDSVARMVASLRDIDGVTRVGLSSSVQSAEGAEASASSEETDGACQDSDNGTFEITVAFDEVIVDSEGVITPQPPAEPTGPGAEVGAERRATEEGVASAEDQAQEAVNDYVPGK
jgi:Tfp pilus assembly protein PilN